MNKFIFYETDGDDAGQSATFICSIRPPIVPYNENKKCDVSSSPPPKLLTNESLS